MPRGGVSAEALPGIFVKFSCDLVSYGLLQILDVHWESPYLKFKGWPFDEIVGMAAVVFRNRHVDEFNDDIDESPHYIFRDDDTVLEYLRQFIRKTFKGNVPLMEFIVYCAFLVHLSVCCFEEKKLDYISDIVEETFDVYERHVKPYYHVIGGWEAISQMAVQYLEFVKSMRMYGNMVREKTASTILSVEDKTHLSATASSGADRNDSNADMEVTPETTARDSHASSSNIEYQNSSHSKNLHLTGSDDGTSAGVNDSTGDSTRDISSNGKGSNMNDSSGCSRVCNSATGSKNSRVTAVGDDSSEGISDRDASDDDDRDHHLHVTSSRRYFRRDGEGKDARVTATADAREASSADDCELEPETSGYPRVVYMRNGLVIPSTVTSENALTRSADANSMESDEEDMHSQ